MVPQLVAYLSHKFLRPHVGAAHPLGNVVGVIAFQHLQDDFPLLSGQRQARQGGDSLAHFPLTLLSNFAAKASL